MVERAGVDVVMRPNRAYPGMIVAGTIGEGTVEVIEELLTRGKDSLEVFNVKEESFLFGRALGNLSMAGIGTIVAVIYKDGHVDPNPKGTDEIKDAKKIIIMVEDMTHKDYDQIQREVDLAMAKKDF
jgi:Trk K+ transport system NAD-binding subunit